MNRYRRVLILMKNKEKREHKQCLRVGGTSELEGQQGLKRKAHVVMDMPSRELKALKIERLLGLENKANGKPLQILEIGCGTGGISYYFATHSNLNCVVNAVDINDNRQVSAAYQFHLVDSVLLPFENAFFDVVISNHVIEHVGDIAAQNMHLKEIKRVLKLDGVAYLAVPNRWMVTEPHYKLRFLSWLPHSWRTPYLKWRGKGEFYDCEPLAMTELEKMLAVCDYRWKNICIDAFRETLDIEHPNAFITGLVRMLPDAFFKPMKALIPTLIYRLKHTEKV